MDFELMSTLFEIVYTLAGISLMLRFLNGTVNWKNSKDKKENKDE